MFIIIKQACTTFNFQVSDITTALESNAKRSDDTRVPDDVVRNMAERLEPPDPLSNPWESFSFAIDVESWRKDFDQLLPTVLSVIEAARASPVVASAEPDRRAAEASRLANDKSVLHRVDKRLRKIVGERIAQQALTSDSEALTVVGLDMVKVRTQVLKELKSGDNPDFCLPEDLVAKIKDETSSCDAEIDVVLNKMFDLKLSPADQ